MEVKILNLPYDMPYFSSKMCGIKISTSKTYRLKVMTLLMVIRVLLLIEASEILWNEKLAPLLQKGFP